LESRPRGPERFRETPLGLPPQGDNGGTPSAAGLVSGTPGENLRVLLKLGVDKCAECTRPLAMDDPNFENSLLSAFPEPDRQQIRHLARAKGVQIKFAGHRNRNRTGFIGIIHSNDNIPDSPSDRAEAPVYSTAERSRQPSNCSLPRRRRLSRRACASAVLRSLTSIAASHARANPRSGNAGSRYLRRAAASPRIARAWCGGRQRQRSCRQRTSSELCRNA